MRPRTYLTSLGATVLTLAALSVALTVFVDPYRMYGTAEIPRWTALKPEIYDRTGIAKTYSLDRAAPQTLLLGNSRVEIGFDPASAVWPDRLQPVFNAAEAGRDLFVAFRLLQHASAMHPPSLAIVGLDILDFLEKPDTGTDASRPVSPDELRLLVDRDGSVNTERPLQIWRDRVTTTLTIDAILDSLATLFDQDPRYSVTMTEMGFNPLNEYRLYVTRSGYHELFRQKEAIYEAQYRHYFTPDFGEPDRYASFRHLQRLVEIAQAHGCRLLLFIHPYHANYLEMLHRTGLWPSFEAWKRSLVRIVERNAGDGKSPIELIDFSGYDRFTTEPVPPAGSVASDMRWYWESGHYKRELGDLMVARMLSGTGEFGRTLTSANIERELDIVRADRARYVTGLPDSAVSRN